MGNIWLSLRDWQKTLTGRILTYMQAYVKDFNWSACSNLRVFLNRIDIKPRTLSRNELLQQAKFIKPALWKKIETGRREEFDEQLWNITMDEVREKRWLDGPYSFEEFEVMFDGVWLPVRRFAVLSGVP